ALTEEQQRLLHRDLMRARSAGVRTARELRSAVADVRIRPQLGVDPIRRRDAHLAALGDRARTLFGEQLQDLIERHRLRQRRRRGGHEKHPNDHASSSSVSAIGALRAMNAYAMGNTKSVTATAVKSPPMITTANGRCVSLPTALENAAGARPR